MDKNFSSNNTLQLSFHFSGLAKQQLSPLLTSSCCKLFAVVWRRTLSFWDSANRGHNNITGAEPERGAAAVLYTLK